MPAKGWRKYALGKKPKDAPLMDREFNNQCQELGLPEPEIKFRLNCGGILEYCWGEYEIAIVMEGEATREVCNQASIEGWRVLRCLPEDVKSGHAARMVYLSLHEGVIT